MKSEAELKAVTQFVAEYATRLMGSGVHTSRVVRNTKRLGEALGVRVMVSAFQKVVTFSVYDDESGRVYSEVADIPPLPISFELNSELSALSWDACDLRLPLAEIRRRYDEIVARPRLDPIFTLILVGLAFAASMYASVAMIFDTTSEVAIATSVLYLIPGVPLINGVIDIVEGHVLNGIARLTSALMLIVCIAVGLSCTLMIVKNGLL